MNKDINDVIKKSLKKDRRAQNELYKLCYTSMMNIAWKYSSSNAEAVEFVNAGFLKVIINLKKYKNETPFEFWLKRVVKNEVIDILRKKNRYSERMEIREVERLPETNSITDPVENENLLWIQKMAGKLPNMTSKVFEMYVFEGYKHAEIAELLEMSEGTSQWHYSVAKKQLKEWANEKQNLSSTR